MNRSALATFEQEIHQHLHGFYLPFWCGPALDQKNGGWMGWLANDLTPDRTQPKGLIVNARILWAFSAAYRYGDTKDPRYLDMARRAHAFLLEKFWDKQRGGAFWRVDDVGNVIDDSKKIYGQAFVIYALSEYFLATNHAEALTQARALFHLVEQHAHDAAHGGYIEVKKRDWSEAGPEAAPQRQGHERKKIHEQPPACSGSLHQFISRLAGRNRGQPVA